MRKLTDFADAHLRIFDRPPVPPPEHIEDVFLIGICGTGMGALAGLFQQAGFSARGSDKAAYPPMSTRLAEMGIDVHEGFDPSHLNPNPDLVIVGNACTPTHPEASYARENNLVQQSLPEALAHFFIRDRRSLVVAGTHGKTTTTGLLVHVFRSANRDPGFLVGGVMVGDNISYRVGSGRYFIVEGDEYDSAYFDKRPKFLHYRPTSAIVTSMEFDHADIYHDFDEYRIAFETLASIIHPSGSLVLNGDDENVHALAKRTYARVRHYGLEPHNDITANGIVPLDGGQRFTLKVDGTDLGEMFLPMGGQHNLMNALAVCAIALAEGINPDELRQGLASFEGMKRRQEVRGKVNDIVVIDDFAHHPTAVRATIDAIAECWPNRRLVAVFEPRSNSSRRKVFEAAYATAFARASLAFISAPPLRHNDRAEDFLDAQTLIRQIEQNGTSAFLGTNPDELLPPLLDSVRTGDVVLIMSNGSFGNIHQQLLDQLKALNPA